MFKDDLTKKYMIILLYKIKLNFMTLIQNYCVKWHYETKHK